MRQKILVNEYINKVINIQPDNLIGYWPLIETNNGPIAYDYSRFGSAGFYATGQVVSQGQSGIGDGRTSCSFNGTTSYINVYNNILVKNFNGYEGTLSLWVKVANAGVWTDGVERVYFLLAANTSLNYVRIYKNSTNNQLVFDTVMGGTSKLVASTVVNTGWLNLALTYSKVNDSLKAYGNGTQLGSTQTNLGNWSGSLLSTSCLIGSQTSTPANVCSGFIAHVALWDKALLANQIQMLYQL